MYPRIVVQMESSGSGPSQSPARPSPGGRFSKGKRVQAQSGKSKACGKADPRSSLESLFDRQLGSKGYVNFRRSRTKRKFNDFRLTVSWARTRVLALRFLFPRYPHPRDISCLTTADLGLGHSGNSPWLLCHACRCSYSQGEYDTFDPKAAQFQRFSFLRRRSRIVEIVAARDLLFALAHSGACAAISLGEEHHLLGCMQLLCPSLSCAVVSALLGC